MGAHTHIGPKHRMQQCKGKRAASVILQQMMSNKSDDSITTNSQYGTQVPWLLLTLLRNHCTQDPNCKVPMELLGLHQLFQFISCNIPCLCLNKRTHTHTFPLPSDNSQSPVVFLVSVHIQGCLFLIWQEQKTFAFSLTKSATKKQEKQQQQQEVEWHKYMCTLCLIAFLVLACILQQYRYKN